MPRRFRKWLIGVGGSLLVLALLPLNDHLIKVHPSALWVEMGAMGVAMFITQYKNELRKRS